MRIGLALAAVLTPLAASGVTLTVNNTTQGILVGASNCNTLTLTARWDLQVTPISTDRVRLLGAASGSGACGTTNSLTAPDLSFFDQTNNLNQTGAVSVSASQMALLSCDAGVPVSPCVDPNLLSRSSANPLSNTMCVQYIQNSVLNGNSLTTASVPVKFALAQPFPPENVVITPGDSHLKIAWSKGDPGEDIATYDIHVVPEGSAPGTPVANTSSTNVDVSTTDFGQHLQNDAGYTITIVANDTYGNISEPSDEQTGTPVASADFYNHYRDLGGASPGGCSSGGGPALIAAGALALALLLRRRSKARNGAALIALVALFAPGARAEDTQRPIRFLLGLKLDRYDPRVDSQPGLTGQPYHDVFRGRAPGRFQIEFDYVVAHPFGAIMVGVTAGFWQNIGKAILRSSPPGSPQQSGDTTLLNVFPFGLIATWRFDWLQEQWRRAPVIPYAPVGLMQA